MPARVAAALVLAAATAVGAVGGQVPDGTAVVSVGVAGGGPAPPPGDPGAEPPAVASAPPPGRRPSAAAGLRVPDRCTPPAADGPVAPGTGGERLQLATAHRFATGRGQLIAVIDTGVHPHERLDGRLRGGGDYLTGGDGLDDCDGHGTAVAGILAAAPAAGGAPDGVVGAAPDASLLAIRQASPSYEVTDPDGTVRPAGDTTTLADAVVLAVRSGATVVNISEAVCLAPARAATAGDPVHAALAFAAREDVVVVAAAGNTGTGGCGAEPGQVSLPGWYDDLVLTVGAVGPDDAPAPFTVPGPWVDVAAPGTGLRSLAVGGGTTAGGTDGTSFAAPWVAGLAALVRERFPDMTAARVVDRILATSRRSPGGDAIGYGVVDPVAALTAPPDAPGDPGSAEPRTATLAGTTPGPPTAAPGWPVDLAALALVLAAAAATALALRRRRG